MLGFPTLQLAFILIVDASPGNYIGTVASGSSLTYYPISIGTLISVPGFSPEVNATIISGGDHIYLDPDGARIRVNVDCLAKTDDDIILRLDSHGSHHLTDEMKKVLSGETKDARLPFGQSTTYLTFEVGSGKYKELENYTFVGNGRFIVKDGKVSVESRISVVVSSTVKD